MLEGAAAATGFVAAVDVMLADGAADALLSINVRSAGTLAAGKEREKRIIERDSGIMQLWTIESLFPPFSCSLVGAAKNKSQGSGGLRKQQFGSLRPDETSHSPEFAA